MYGKICRKLWISKTVSAFIFLDNPLNTEIFQRLQILQNTFYPPWSAKQLEGQLVSSKGLNMGVMCDQQLVGFIFYQILFEQAEILQVAIDPSYQQRGLAAKLLLKSFTHLQLQKQVESVLLEVRASNLAAIKLYEHLDFSLNGRRKGYYPSEQGSREDALLYTKTLLEND